MYVIRFLKLLTGVTIAAYLPPYCALSSSRNAAKQRCTLPVGSCLNHVFRHRRQTYYTRMLLYLIEMKQKLLLWDATKNV